MIYFQSDVESVEDTACDFIAVHFRFLRSHKQQNWARLAFPTLGNFRAEMVIPISIKPVKVTDSSAGWQKNSKTIIMF